eukprot:486582_1
MALRDSCCENNECISTCLEIIRIAAILERYHSIQNGIEFVDQILITVCHYDEILNAFFHILSVHSAQFEDIERIMMKLSNENQVCSGNCILFRRNHRNRVSDGNTESLFSLYASRDVNTICMLRLLDKIHCHFLHSRQAGHRFRHFPSKHQQPKANCLLNKFFVNAKQYSLGYRFFYWSHYKNSNDLCDPADWRTHIECVPDRVANKGFTLRDCYIPRKYKSFKIEITKNSIKNISMYQWDYQLLSAKKHCRSKHFKSFICARLASARYYELRPFSNITQYHILSVMLYCNFDNLQKEFTTTFRMISETENFDQFKKKHSNFYWWARYLRESVECFGMTSKKDFDQTYILYHGVTGQFSLPSLFASVKGPMSATISRSVAQQFGQQGMIMVVELKISDSVLSFNESHDAIERISCFDCKYLSDYSSEAEMLFIGGLNHFTFCNVIDVVSSTNYEMWINAVKLITNDCICVDGWRSDKIMKNMLTEHIIKMAYILVAKVLVNHYPLDNKLKKAAAIDCPPYIAELTKNHLATVHSVTLCKDNINPINGLFLKSNSNKNAWFDLKRVRILLPNVEKISFHAYGKEMQFIENDNLYQSVLNLLKAAKNYAFSLPLIAIDIDPKNVSVFHLSSNKYVQKFQNNFKQFGWQIKLHKIDQYKEDLNTFVADTTDKWDLLFSPIGSVQPWPIHPLNIMQNKLDIASVLVCIVIYFFYFIIPTYLSDPEYYGQVSILKDLVVRSIILLTCVVWCAAKFSITISDIIDQFMQIILFRLSLYTGLDPSNMKQDFLFLELLMASIAILACDVFNYCFHLLSWYGIIEFCQIWFVHRWISRQYSKYPAVRGSNSVTVLQIKYFFTGFTTRTIWSIIGCWIATHIISPLLIFREFMMTWTNVSILLVLVLLVMDTDIFRYLFGDAPIRTGVLRTVGFGVSGLLFFYNDLYLGQDQVHNALSSTNQNPSAPDYFYYTIRRIRLFYLGNKIFTYVCPNPWMKLSFICDNIWKQMSLCHNGWILVPLQDLQWMSIPSEYLHRNTSVFQREFMAHKMALRWNGNSCTFTRKVYSKKIPFQDVIDAIERWELYNESIPVSLMIVLDSFDTYTTFNDSVQRYLQDYQPILHSQELYSQYNVRIFYHALFIAEYSHILITGIIIIIWFVSYCRIFKCCHQKKKVITIDIDRFYLSQRKKCGKKCG